VQAKSCVNETHGLIGEIEAKLSADCECGLKLLKLQEQKHAGLEDAQFALLRLGHGVEFSQRFLEHAEFPVAFDGL